jgi:rhodanese-related sulfurtransferase
MKTFKQLIDDTLPHIKEIFPWDLEELLEQKKDPLLIDITEAKEFKRLHIKNSINVPRGILEAACDWDYTDTLPELAKARDQEIIIVCRSGNRSVLAAFTMQLMGFTNVASLKTGLRGWNDYELALYDSEGNEVDIDAADEYFSAAPRGDQMGPDE